MPGPCASPCQPHTSEMRTRPVCLGLTQACEVHEASPPPGGHPATFPQHCPASLVLAPVGCGSLFPPSRPPAGSSLGPQPVLLPLGSHAPGTSVRHTVGTKSVLLGRRHPQRLQVPPQAAFACAPFLPVAPRPDADAFHERH